MAYAEVSDVQARMSRTLSESEQTLCEALLEDAAVMIDEVKPSADMDIKKLVSIRMVIRAVGSGGDIGVPIGATQGSMSALGYSQSWTVGSGSVGELYFGKSEKSLLGLGNRIGSRSPLERIPEKECDLP